MVSDTDVWLEDFLLALFEKSGLDLWVSGLGINEETRTFTAVLDGKDKAIAIGRDGQMLDAIQHLTVSAAANCGIFKDRLIIDIDDYRKRRDDRIIEDAEYFADDAIYTNAYKDLEPMNSRERRLVHMVISKINGVESQSHGFGDERFVRIVPIPQKSDDSQ